MSMKNNIHDWIQLDSIIVSLHIIRLKVESDHDINRCYTPSLNLKHSK